MESCEGREGNFVCRVENRTVSLRGRHEILLRTGTRTCFIGDAAGLIHNITGAGISYALTSARRLAQAFLKGDSYEEMMFPLAETVTQLARDAKKSQFLTRFTIMKRGSTI